MSAEGCKGLGRVVGGLRRLEFLSLEMCGGVSSEEIQGAVRHDRAAGAFRFALFLRRQRGIPGRVWERE